MNVLGWMLYCGLVSGLLVGSGLALERVLALYRRPVRGVWIAAILLSFLIPAAAHLGLRLPGSGYDISADAVGRAVVELSAIGEASGETAGGGLARIDAALLGLWIVGSLGMLVYLLRSAFVLRTHAGRSRPMRVDGHPISVSESLGPGVSSLLGSRIVIPRALLALEDDLVRLVVLHEEEHLRAGDHRWLLLGLAALVLEPWNPFVWWSVRRLRLAVELDCDARVLGRSVSPASYAEALVAVAECRTTAPGLTAAFTHRSSQLERRLRAMIPKQTPFRGAAAVVGCAFAVLLLALACDSTLPGDLDDDPVGAADAVSGAEAPAQTVAPEGSARPEGEAETVQDPVFTPFTERPQLIDPDAAARKVQESYPELLRSAGIGGTVDIWLYVNQDGRVEEARVATSSGDERLDRAGLRAARQFRMHPARNGDESVAVWFQIPITYRP